jgi:hypothetical protein
VKLNEEHFSLCHFAEEVYADSCRERDEREQQKSVTGAETENQ